MLPPNDLPKETSSLAMQLSSSVYEIFTTLCKERQGIVQAIVAMEKRKARVGPEGKIYLATRVAGVVVIFLTKHDPNMINLT